jgi:hypothetical protein
MATSPPTRLGFAKAGGCTERSRGHPSCRHVSGKPDMLLGYVFHEHNVLHGPKVYLARNEVPPRSGDLRRRPPAQKSPTATGIQLR